MLVATFALYEGFRRVPPLRFALGVKAAKPKPAQA